MTPSSTPLSGRETRLLPEVPTALEEIRPGLFRVEIAISNAPGKVNIFLEVGPRGVLVVDAASDYPQARAAVADALRQIGRKLTDISDIVISHLHIDHYGMAGWLAEVSGAPVWIHEGGSFELWRHWNPQEAGARLAAFARTHGVSPERALRIAALDDWRYLLSLPPRFRQLVDAQVHTWASRAWKVIFTPGHASGHICLWSAADGVLVGGDQLLAKGHAAVRWFNDELPDPLGAYLRGVQSLGALPASVLLPGHGPTIVDVPGIVEATQAHHRAALDALMAHLDQPRSAMELATLMRGELSDFRLRVVLTEVVAGLRHLEVNGHVVSMLHDNVIHFGKTDSSKRQWSWGIDLGPADIPARPTPQASGAS